MIFQKHSFPPHLLLLSLPFSLQPFDLPQELPPFTLPLFLLLFQGVLRRTQSFP